MQTIQQLDEKTINKIAAGEVVESPASVVKELVENALDAGATEIFIEITGGGRDSIRIQDNGCGMSKEDAKIATLRHTTSKLKSIDDLWQIQTMGFRGEALSSIAAVSEFSLYTAQKGPKGTLVRVTGGSIPSIEEIEMVPGTIIEVRDLFFNVPARRKFQKSPNIQAKDVIQVVSEIALSNPQVAFDLVCNHKKELFLPVRGEDNLLSRIEDTLGRDFQEKLLWVSHEKEGIQISGYISRPEHSWPNKTAHYFSVNKRVITSKELSSAIKEGYATLMEKTRFPACVLSIRINENLVDVNIHPQKKHVRFSLEQKMESLCIDAVQRTLFSLKTPVIEQIEQPPLRHVPVQEKREWVQEKPCFFEEKKEGVFQEPQEKTFFSEETLFHLLGFWNHYIFALITFSERHEKFLPKEIQKQDGFFIIDAKRAKNRIVYEEVLQKKMSEEKSMQMLLSPCFIEVSCVEAKNILEHGDLLEKAGCLLRPFGATSFLIEAIPSYVPYIEAASFVRELIATILEKKEIALFEKSHIAKVHAEKAKLPELSIGLCQELLRELFRCSNPIYTASGAVTLAKIEQEEIEKKLKK